MPGAVPRTSTLALTNATLPYVVALANKGAEDAMRADPSLASGLNTYRGEITHAALGKSLGIAAVEPAGILA
jgi:alanine dehydrogenase